MFDLVLVGVQQMFAHLLVAGPVGRCFVSLLACWLVSLFACVLAFPLTGDSFSYL